MSLNPVNPHKLPSVVFRNSPNRVIEQNVRVKRRLVDTENDNKNVSSDQKAHERGQELRHRLNLMSVINENTPGSTMEKIEAETEAMQKEIEAKNLQKYGDENPSMTQEVLEVVGNLDSQGQEFSRRCFFNFPSKITEKGAVEIACNLPVVGPFIRMIKWMSGN
jgi:hypothetical protein